MIIKCEINQLQLNGMILQVLLTGDLLVCSPQKTKRTPALPRKRQAFRTSSCAIAAAGGFSCTAGRMTQRSNSRRRDWVGRRPLKWKWQEVLGSMLKIYIPCISRSMYIRHFCIEKYMDQDTIHGFWLIQYTINAWPLCFNELI